MNDLAQYIPRKHAILLIALETLITAGMPNSLSYKMAPGTSISDLIIQW